MFLNINILTENKVIFFRDKINLALKTIKTVHVFGKLMKEQSLPPKFPFRTLCDVTTIWSQLAAVAIEIYKFRHLWICNYTLHSTERSDPSFNFLNLFVGRKVWLVKEVSPTNNARSKTKQAARKTITEKHSRKLTSSYIQSKVKKEKHLRKLTISYIQSKVKNFIS